MAEMRLGKLEKRLLLDAYEKTVLERKPYGMDYAHPWNYKVLDRDEIFANYFRLELKIEYRAPKPIPSIEYDKARVSISRSTHQLIEKGLIPMGWTSTIRLTEKGKEVAESLLNKDKCRLKAQTLTKFFPEQS